MAEPPIKTRLQSTELTNQPTPIQDKLNACLAADSAHIKPGQKGDHVAVIQKALNTIRLRKPDLGLPEIKDSEGDFGSDTRTAVLTYKTKNAIKRSGQPLDPIVGRMTLTRLDDDLMNGPVPPGKPDPATDPREKEGVEALLALNRSSVPLLIAKALQALPKCKAALELAKRSPFQAGHALLENQVGIDGLNRHFHISGNNLEVIDSVVGSYKKLLEKVTRLPIDQAATDYPTFVHDAPELAFNRDGTQAKVPAFSDTQRGKMFFNPIYRSFVPGAKEPFGGLAPIALQAIQIHEMCHFYLSMDDGNPANSTTARCLKLAQSFQLFVMQLALGRPFP
jgi:peptidoglycan hydrolase-like protein with peptidoglycan-binding domain